MLDSITDRHAEREQQNLRDCPERSAEDDITNGPAVFKSAEDEDELRDDVDDSTDQWPEDVDDP